jgi:hypothetical protein
LLLAFNVIPRRPVSGKARTHQNSKAAPHDITKRTKGNRDVAGKSGKNPSTRRRSKSFRETTREYPCEKLRQAEMVEPPAAYVATVGNGPQYECLSRGCRPRETAVLFVGVKTPEKRLILGERKCLISICLKYHTVGDSRQIY